MIKTKMRRLPIIRGCAPSPARSNRRSCEIAEGQQSFTHHEDTTDRCETKQDENTHFGSDYVVVGGDTSSECLEEEECIDLETVPELSVHSHREATISPPESKHSMTCESGLEVVNSSFASRASHPGPSTPLVSEPSSPSNENYLGLVCTSDDSGNTSIETEYGISASHRRDINRWLSSTDPSSNHNTASQKRVPSTGHWFLNHPEFLKWQSAPNSMLWLNGIPGSGKTILSSAIIDDLQARTKEHSDTLVAYFYFAFDDVEKQRPQNLLRSLIAQLTRNIRIIPEPLNAMHELFHNSQPPMGWLKGVLLSILKLNMDSFIIMDALDECSLGSDRKAMLSLLEEISSWSLANVHILVTSRRERDIESVLLELSTAIICIQTPGLDADIQSYIVHELATRPRLAKWPPDVKNEIENKLMSGAEGMFLWVFCQLDALEKCSNARSIRKALKTVPKTLDETYARMLLAIENDNREEARTALIWLLVSERPLLIEELAEALAIDPEGEPPFDPEKRLEDPSDVLYILSSLVYVSRNEERGNHDSPQTPRNGYVVKFVHYSVREYLVSDQAQQRETKSILGLDLVPFSLHETHKFVSESCAAYIINYSQVDKKTPSDDFANFPLLEYACQYWYTHAQSTLDDTRKSQSSSTHKLMLSDIAFSTWLKVHRPDYPPKPQLAEVDTTGSPVYYACFLGLLAIIKHLLNSGVDINVQGGYYGTALQAASVKGDETVIRFLIEHGADVDARAGYYNTALQAASVKGHLDIVQLLLDHGADPNAQGGYYNTALQAASVKGHLDIVQLLLDHGADPNAQGGYYGNALVGASRGGVVNVVLKLIQHGADTAATGCYGYTAWRRMWEGGAQIQKEDSETQPASLKNAPTKLDAEDWQPFNNFVDTESRSDSKATALLVAAAYGHKQIVQLLLDRGASYTAEDSNKWTPLHWAAEAGLDAVVVRLFKVGAKIEPKDREGRSPISWAAGRGHLSTVELFVKHGAEVDSKDVEGQTPLSWAAARGHASVVALLLEAGAEIESKDEEGQTALSWASWNGHETVVKILLEAGADFESKDRTGRTPLYWAAEDEDGHHAVVKLLLVAGADVNARDTTNNNTPLSIASKKGHQTVVQLLLDAGAHPDA